MKQAQTKDGAGGGPAEERTCTWGRDMRLFKIGAHRTRIRGRGDILFTESDVDVVIQSIPAQQQV